MPKPNTKLFAGSDGLNFYPFTMALTARTCVKNLQIYDFANFDKLTRRSCLCRQ